MRRKLSKAKRQQVYEKCKGHCAYCGCELEYKNMQVDHVKPLRIGGADELSNMLPACRICNYYKSTLDAEGFRKYLAGIVQIVHRLMRDSIPFQVATRFGIVKHMGDSVKFYFERFQKPGSEEYREIEQKIPTNADHIRSMSDEEMADFLEKFQLGDINYSITFCDLCEKDGNALNLDCKGCLKHWLSTEVEDKANER